MSYTIFDFETVEIRILCNLKFYSFETCLYPDDQYGTTFMDLIRDEVEAYGGEVIIEAVAYDTAMILFDLVTRNDIQFRSEIKNELMNL